MTVFNTAYDTTACKNHRVSVIVEALITARIRGILHSKIGSPEIYPVIRDRMLDEMVPAFYHPIVSAASGENLVYVDVRPYTKQDPRSLDNITTNQDGYDGAILRADLQEQWSDGNYAGLRNLRLAGNVFPNWISENITKRLNLGPGEQWQISVLAAVFYYSLFLNEDSSDFGDKSIMIPLVARATGMKPALVQDIVEKVPHIECVNDFCEKVREVVNNVRLNNLNTSTLYTMMAGTWYGNNAAETVAVALEHPPTWITLVYQAATSRTFYHSGLAKMLERGQYKREVRDFVIALRG